MTDRFLPEITDLHQLRKDIRSLPPAKTEEFMKRLGDDAADDWVFRARDAQLPPTDLDWCWLFLGGRGAGKSHSMSAAVHMAVRAGISRIHLIAPTTADFHDVNLEGRSGILGHLRSRSAPALGVIEAAAGVAERRNVRVLLGRGAGKPARSAMRIVRDR